MVLQKIKSLITQKLVFQEIQCWASVAHYNLSYLGGSDKEDRSSRPAQANSLQDPTLKISKTKKGWYGGSSGIVPA
jgi:hypothetical protein